MKCRAMLVALGLAALTYSVGAQTDEPGKKSGDSKEAADKSFKLAQDLRTVLDTLREDSRANKLREERERLEKLLKDLEKVIHDQKIVQTITEINKTDKSDLQKQQNKVTQATK